MYATAKNELLKQELCFIQNLSRISNFKFIFFTFQLKNYFVAGRWIYSQQILAIPLPHTNQLPSSNIFLCQYNAASAIPSYLRLRQAMYGYTKLFKATLSYLRLNQVIYYYTKLFTASPSYWRLHQAIYGTKLFTATPSYLRLHQLFKATPSYLRLHQAIFTGTPSYLRLHQAIYGFTKLFTATPSYLRLHQVGNTSYHKKTICKLGHV